MVRTPRIAHLGLGAFARAHQVWYTEPSMDWGIVAIPNRSMTILDRLEEQGFVYALLVRGPETDVPFELSAVIDVSAGALADPNIVLMTMTVSEAGYLPGAHPIGVIADGLRARRDADGGPLALVPCDNVPANGAALRDALLASVEPELASWIDDTVSFVSTMVDRITPAATDADRAIARELLGWDDEIPVVTEPFTEWVLQGDFPAGRPDWESAGAQFVDDVEPYENRKLWLLNAAHSLMAYRGLETGRETVFDAWADPVLAAEVEQLWSEARAVLSLPAAEVDEWLARLRVRWQNPRIEHRLEQIAQGGEQKIPARIEAVIRERELAGLKPGTAELETIAAYKRYRKAHP
jgi:fructuronate reductase